MIRFALVGCLAVTIQYAAYCLLLSHLHHNGAFAASYALSFIFNFICTAYYSFRVKPNVRRLAGFAFSHLVNFLLQGFLLNLFLRIGIPDVWAMLPVFVICVPSNFLLVRYFMKRASILRGR